jgi:tRNA threonylcarbamoyl adenosine modification protein YeaZ
MTRGYEPGGLILAIDTATRSSIVAVGRPQPLAISRREVRHRHGTHLLEQIDEALSQAGATAEDVEALVVGTGPGSFTGLRVGLATAKTLAYVRDLPLAGVVSADALRHAAGRVTGGSADAVVVMPAGASDHYVAAPGAEPVLVPPGGLAAALGDAAVLAVDLAPELLGSDATRLGAAALEGLAASLLEMGAARLADARLDDPATLVPAYVASPRGIRHGPMELGWSPDLR